MNIEKLTSENLISRLENESRTIIIDFYADWCMPCKMVHPIMEEISNERQDVIVYKINIEEEPNLAAQFSVMSIPTLVIVKEGKIQTTIVGAHPKQFILDKIGN